MSDDRPASGLSKPRIWLWIAAIGVLGLIVLLGSLGMWRTNQQGDLARRRAEITDRGEPVSANDLEVFYVAPSESEDTTKLWLDGMAPLALPAFGQAAAHLPLVGANGESTIPPPGEEWEDLPAAEKLLAQYQSALALLHQAAERGGAARFPTSFKNGIAMLLPHAQNIRNASRLLALEAHVRAHRRDPQGAAKSIEAALAAGKALEAEPLMISQLVRMACDSNARSQLHALLPHVPFAEDDLVRLQDRLSKIEYRTGLRRGLLGERVVASLALGDLRQFTVAAGGAQGSEFLLPLFSPGAQQLYLEYMEQTLAAADLSWPQAISESTRIQAELTASAQTAGLFNQLKYSLTGSLAGSYESAFKATARHAAENDATVAAIAIERCRRQHGRFPTQLGELVPEFMKSVPLDPFNGQPLKYVPGENDYLIYNVGEDGIDNGGQGDDTGKPDDVLRIEYPTAESDGAERP